MGQEIEAISWTQA